LTPKEKGKVKKLMTFRIVKDKLLYMIGIPRKYAADNILRSRAFCGKFGQPERIVINYNPKEVYEGQVAVYVHYKTSVNVAIALKVSSIFLIIVFVSSVLTGYR
jgi:hypothetical protein